jgi:integrase
VSAQRGSIFRTANGLWAIRFRDTLGRRPQRTGFRTRGEARQALDEELRRVRLGPLFRPNATLRQLYDAYLDQYDVAPSTVAFLKDNMKPALATFGDERVGELRVDKIAAWRKGLPEGKRYRSLRSLRQVLAAGVRWKWIEDNPAVLVKNPEPKPGEIDPFDSWAEIDAIDAELDEVGGALVQFLCGSGVRPEEAFGGDWRDVELERRMFRVRRAYAKGRLKDFAKTAGSTRAVPLRERVVEALQAMPGKRRGILFPAPEGGRIDINNWRNRFWTPSLEAAGVKHRRIYDLRHTYATWSLAAGIDIFTLARRMGTSVKMIDRTYGHLVAGADTYERELLDAFDRGSKPLGRYLDAEAERDAA